MSRLCSSGTLLLVSCLIVFTTSCSNNNAGTQATPPSVPLVQSFPISAVKLVNCRFTNASPTYTVGAAVTPNPVVCDQGTPTAGQVLNSVGLPTGLTFDLTQIALTGTPTVKLASTNLTIYVENAAGYVEVPINLTIQ